jgi:MGT family glycosyltransferase
MSKVIFIVQPQIGHLNTLLTIALQMKEDGHQPAFLVPGIEGSQSNIEIFKTAALIPSIIKKAGLPVDLIAPSLLAGLLAILLPRASGYLELSLALEISSLGIEKSALGILKQIERQRPDIIVSDYTLYAAYIAAERAGVPCALVYHTGLPFKGRMIPPFGSGLPIGESDSELRRRYLRYEKVLMRHLDARINRVRAKLGLPPMAEDIFRRPYSRWLNLITSAMAIEAPRENLTDNTIFLGPCFSQRQSAVSDFPFQQLRADKFKIYVSFGTVFNKKPKIFSKIMRALNHPDYQIIISAGGAFNELMRSPRPENVMLFRSVPQVDLLPRVDLVIGHGGNNSTNETLAAGKPLIVMPVGGEQGDNASRVEYLRAGLRVNIHNFDERELAAKVNAIRSDEKYQQRALELKTALAETGGAKLAASLIQNLLANHKK